jgi:glycosyltransferase 2 family protein
VAFNTKKIISTIIPFFIGIGLIYWQFTSLKPEEINQIIFYFKNANYAYVALSIFISLFGYWSRAYRWKYALNHLGYKTKFHNDFFAVCISYLVNLTIPRSGELSRALVLKKYENVPFDKGFGTIVAERIVDFCIFLLFVTVAFILQFDTLSAYIFKHLPPEKIFLFSSILLASFVVFIYLWKKSQWKIILLLKEKVSGVVEGMTSILKMKKKWKYLLHSFFIWFCYLLMFYVCIFAIPETASISFDIVVMGFVFGTVAVGFSSGGLGAFPVSIQTVLMLYGISKSAGAAMGWIVWTSQTILTIVLGLLSYILIHFFNKNKA